MPDEPVASTKTPLPSLRKRELPAAKIQQQQGGDPLLKFSGALEHVEIQVVVDVADGEGEHVSLNSNIARGGVLKAALAVVEKQAVGVSEDPYVEIRASVVVEICRRNLPRGPTSFRMYQNVDSRHVCQVRKNMIPIVAQESVGPGRVVFIRMNAGDMEVQVAIPVVVQPDGVLCVQTVGQIAFDIYLYEQALIVAQKSIVRKCGQEQVHIAVVVMIPENGAGASWLTMETRRDEGGLIDKVAADPTRCAAGCQTRTPYRWGSRHHHPDGR